MSKGEQKKDKKQILEILEVMVSKLAPSECQCRIREFLKDKCAFSAE